ncbi:hypothetical protein BC777_0270 [Yoonia maricola]|uniref:Uncharacterized protein n=1 Tax=Yoonia maricola TaxID=420999 RepID=A0A2M8WKI3_9RHOB|nr:hypothetical protein [Yoonia maricola]PJI91442.1 hypothetical protein BC777_0270 [Yoonia maricola]
MGQHINPQIDVTITPALRALLAGQSVTAAGESAREVPARMIHDTVPTATSVPRSATQMQSLRRDGKRPLRFEGLLVVANIVPVRVDDMVLQQHMAIYVDNAGDIYMSLALLIPPDAPARSLFNANKISVQAPEQHLSNWYDRASKIIEQLTPPSPCPDARAPLYSALRSLTSLCLQSERLPIERIRT